MGTLADRLGRCYELAGREVVFGRGGVLVHGSIQGGGNPRIGHAWVIRATGEIYDPVLDAEYTVDAHNRIFNPMEYVRYTQDEVITIICKHQHWGPWDAASFAV